MLLNILTGELVHTGAGFGHYLDEMLVQQCALDSCWHVNHVCSPHSKQTDSAYTPIVHNIVTTGS